MAQVAGDDLTRGAIYLFETGRAWPSRAALEIIAARTGQDMSFFLPEGGADGSGQATASAPARVSRLLAAGRAQEAMELAQQLLQSPLDPAAEARIRIWIARAGIALGRPQSALLHSQDAWRLVEGTDAELEACARLVEVEALHAAEDPVAMETATGALAAVRALEPRQQGVEERLLHLMGTIHAARGEWAAADAAHAQVFDSRHQILERTLAAMEAGAGQVEDPVSWSRAEGVRELRELFALAAASGVELGRARSVLGQPESARQILDATAGFAEALGLTEERCRALLGIADIAMREGEVDEARGHVDLALTLAGRSGDRYTLGLVHLLRGQLAAHAGEAEAADVEFEQALADLKAAGRYDWLLDAHAAYAEVLQAQTRLEDAMRQWKLAVGLARTESRRQADAAFAR